MPVTNAKATDPKLAELKLRARLRGCRLVAEIGITRGLFEETRLRLRDLVARRYTVERISTAYPAIFVTYLVAEGVFSYRGGAYWPSVLPPLGGPDADTTVTGRQFLRAIRALGLERFDYLGTEEPALRYVAPILAHGGVPAYCVPPLLRAVATELDQGVSDARDLLALWRERSWRLDAIAVPVRRFLFSGAPVAFDFLDRLIDLLGTKPADERGKKATGLPEYVVDAYVAEPPEGPRKLRRRGGFVPRPRVTFDPWAHLGPSLELPAATSGRRRVWYVETGAGSARRDDSDPWGFDPVQLAPAGSWSAEVVDSDEGRRRFAFKGLAPFPVLAFDPASGELIDPEYVSCQTVWAVVPERAAVMPEAAVLEELPPLMGAWDGYCGYELDLRTPDGVEIALGGDVHRFRAVESRKPTLAGQRVDGITGELGEPVFSRPPIIELPALGGLRWVGRIRANGESIEIPESSFEGKALDLAPYLPSGVARVEVSLRGPLGLDARLCFLHVPGFQMPLPRQVQTERDGDVELGAVADEGIAIVPPRPIVRAAEDRVTFQVTDGVERLTLVAKIPRLRWALAGHRLASKVLRLDVGDLTDGIPSVLDVRVGVPGVVLSLRLMAHRHSVVQEVHAKTTKRGRWTFDLDVFGDTVRAAPEEFLTLVLDVGGAAMPVARVAREYETRYIRAQDYIRRADGGLATITWWENQAFRGRRIYLWSRWRPWEEPISAPVPDDAAGLVVVESPRLLPGEYFVRVVVTDEEWERPPRPWRRGKGVGSIWLGERQDLDAYLGDLDQTRGRDALIGARATGERWPGLNVMEEAGGLDLVLQLLDAVVNLERGEALDAPFRVLSERLLELPGCGLDAFAEAILARRAHRAALARIAVRLLAPIRCEEPKPVDDRSMRALWGAVPVFAAIADLPAAVNGDPLAEARCRDALGWAPGGGEEPLVSGSIDPPFFSMSIEQLDEIRRMLSLQPGKLLDVGVYGPANLRWLIQQRRLEDASRRRRLPSEWWEEWSPLVDTPLSPYPDGLSLRISDRIRRRAPTPGTPPWAGIPQLSIAAAGHVVAGGDWSEVAAGVVDVGLAIAPELLVSDLVRAVIFDELPGMPTGD